MLKRIHVYDMDGVLVDSSHRYRNTESGAIDLEHWRANRTPANIALDKILPHWEFYRADICDPETYVIICTSREASLNDTDFIVNKLGAPDRIIMRPLGNTENDAILKRRQLQRMFNLRQFAKLPRVLWEDNPKNIDVLRNLFSRIIFVQSNQGK